MAGEGRRDAAAEVAAAGAVGEEELESGGRKGICPLAPAGGDAVPAQRLHEGDLDIALVGAARRAEGEAIGVADAPAGDAAGGHDLALEVELGRIGPGGGDQRPHPAAGDLVADLVIAQRSGRHRGRTEGQYEAAGKRYRKGRVAST